MKNTSSQGKAVHTPRCGSHSLPYPVQSVASLYSTQVSTIHHVRQALAFITKPCRLHLQVQSVSAVAVSTCFMSFPSSSPNTFRLPELLSQDALDQAA